jgi:hypothetical protein
VLLSWRWNGSVDDPAYVLSEVRDHGISELVPVEAAADRAVSS